MTRISIFSHKYNLYIRFWLLVRDSVCLYTDKFFFYFNDGLVKIGSPFNGTKSIKGRYRAKVGPDGSRDVVPICRLRLLFGTCRCTQLFTYFKMLSPCPVLLPLISALGKKNSALGHGTNTTCQLGRYSTKMSVSISRFLNFCFYFPCFKGQSY